MSAAVVSMVVVVVQVVGLVLVLAGFVAAQAGVVRDDAWAYLLVNAVGSAVLAGVALMGRDWVFLVLEGTWAVVSIARLLGRPWRDARPSEPSAKPSSESRWRTTSNQPRARGTCWTARAPRRWGRLLPPERAVHLAGDELSKPGRLTRLFRDSYAGAQGRQWLQPHILWWILLFLRRNGIGVDQDVLDSPQLAELVTSLDLPAGHTNVHPTGQAALNFGLWWPIVGELTRRAHRPWWARRWPLPRQRMPDTAQVETRAWRLGLRPWMSSASYEEMSGIGRALAVIDDHDRRGRTDADHFMVQVLLPGLLIVELHWLHTPGGRPRIGHRAHTEVLFLRRYDDAVTKCTEGRYLTALDHMYLRAGDILTHLSSLPEQSLGPAQRTVMTLYYELHHELHRRHQNNHTTSVNGTDTPTAPAAPTRRSTAGTPVATGSTQVENS